MPAEDPRRDKDTTDAGEPRDLDIVIEDLEPDHEAQSQIGGGECKGQGLETGLS